jgi:hypothetical protein
VPTETVPTGGDAYDHGVQFSKELRAEVLSGDITLTFRLWRTPKVKVGGRYPVGSGFVEVDSVEMVPFASIDDEDLRQTGETDRESLRRRAAHAGPVDDGTLLYRIEFHVLEEEGSQPRRV